MVDLLRRTTNLICVRCGVPAKNWQGGWKHCNSWKSKTPSCGEEPVVVTIAEWEAHPDFEYWRRKLEL
jgi:predicted ATP-dependent serine protease